MGVIDSHAGRRSKVVVFNERAARGLMWTCIKDPLQAVDKENQSIKNMRQAANKGKRTRDKRGARQQKSKTRLK